MLVRPRRQRGRGSDPTGAVHKQHDEDDALQNAWEASFQTDVGRGRKVGRIGKAVIVGRLVHFNKHLVRSRNTLFLIEIEIKISYFFLPRASSRNII